MNEQDVPAAALLMSQFRRLATLLVLNDVPAEDLEHEVRLAADRVRESHRPLLRVVPTAS